MIKQSKWMLLAAGAMAWATAAGAAPLDASGFVSHRAIYTVKLAGTDNKAGFSRADGRIVVEWQNVCDGFTLNQRFVTEFVPFEGRAVVSDARFSSWEAQDGETFRFTLERFVNDMLDESAQGRADRGSGLVTMESGDLGDVALPAGVIFPTEHAVAVVRAAQSGKKVASRVVFDGSEEGASYEAVAFIGKKRRPNGDENAQFADMDGGEALKGQAYWPVTLSYYRTDTAADLPEYEVSYRLYPNGVSSGLELNYGDFALDVDLSALEVFDAPEC